MRVEQLIEELRNMPPRAQVVFHRAKWWPVEGVDVEQNEKLRGDVGRGNGAPVVTIRVGDPLAVD